MLRIRVGQKEPPRPGSTIYCGKEWARKSHQEQRTGSTICFGSEWARKSHQDPGVRFVTDKSGPDRATKIQEYDLIRIRVVQKEPPRPGSTICYG